MPAPLNLLKVEHIPQEADASCLPACVQMVMRFLGREIAQDDLSVLFQALSEGVPRFARQAVARIWFPSDLYAGRRFSHAWAEFENRYAVISL